MKYLKAIFTAICITISGMAGGQGKTGGKAPRRFGIPFLGLLAEQDDGFQWKDLVFLLLIIPLSMGYGVNSTLMGIIGSDWLVRIVYGFLVSIPFYLYSWRRGAIASVLLASAFSVRAGSLGHISWFGDLLIEDIIRYGVLGSLVSYSVFFKPR